MYLEVEFGEIRPCVTSTTELSPIGEGAAIIKFNFSSRPINVNRFCSQTKVQVGLHTIVGGCPCY